MKNPIEVAVYLHHVTEGAYLVSDDGKEDNAVWVPRSQCNDEFDEDDTQAHITLELEEWLATEKGLI